MQLSEIENIDTLQEPPPGWCEERKRLFIQAVATIRSLTDIQHAQAEVNMEPLSAARLQDQARAARIACKNARQAYVRHVRVHGC